MFSRRVISALRAASSQADFTEILLEAFQEDGDHGAVEAQVAVPHAAQGATVEPSPWSGADLWFQTAVRYTIDFARPPFI